MAVPKRLRYSRSSESASGVGMRSADVQPGKRTDPIDACRITQRLVERELQIRIMLDGLADPVHVALGVKIVGDDTAR